MHKRITRFLLLFGIITLSLCCYSKVEAKKNFTVSPSSSPYKKKYMKNPVYNHT